MARKRTQHPLTTADMTRQSLALWQRSLDLYQKNPLITGQQAMIKGAEAYLAWSQSSARLAATMMNLWKR